MPLDKPQWQVIMVPDWEGDETKGLWIWKNHHSLCDGLSCMALYLSLDNEYDTTKMIKFPKINIWYRIYLWILMPISALQVLYESTF
jgi:hypothetical protein